jgi:putative ABC transport system permease protein
MPSGNGNGRDAAALLEVHSHGQQTQIMVAVPLYVSTQQLLAHYGIHPGQIDNSSQVITSRAGLSGLQLGNGVSRDQIANPVIQVVRGLPAGGSQPNSLITESAVRDLGLQLTPAAWIIQTDKPITAAETSESTALAAAAGLTVETPNSSRSVDQIGRVATGVGLLLALGVLVMTVGLIRSETSGELRTLSATGASGRTRRTLTGATAGTLAILGALVGTVGSYVALAAWYHSDLSSLKHVPYVDLALIMLGLPIVASVGGWILGGREPRAIARRPIG